MNIPDDVIDAAARAIHEQVYGPDWWEQDTCAHPARRAEARAALSAALPRLAFDRDEVARIIGGAVYGDPTDLSRATKAADAVIAASPLRSVPDAQAEAIREAATAVNDLHDSEESARIVELLDELARLREGGQP